MAKEVKMNYTEAMVEQILTMYGELGNDGMDAIAAAVGRPVRSVRAKLVREGAYVAPVKGPKVEKEEGPTKKELLIELATLVDFDVEGLTGATKGALADLVAFAKESQDSAADDSVDDLSDESAESE